VSLTKPIHQAISDARAGGLDDRRIFLSLYREADLATQERWAALRRRDMTQTQILDRYIANRVGKPPKLKGAQDATVGEQVKGVGRAIVGGAKVGLEGTGGALAKGMAYTGAVLTAPFMEETLGENIQTARELSGAIGEEVAAGHERTSAWVMEPFADKIEGPTLAAVRGASFAATEEGVPFLMGLKSARAAEMGAVKLYARSPVAQKVGQALASRLSPEAAAILQKAALNGAVGGPAFSVAAGDTDWQSIVGASLLFAALGGATKGAAISRKLRKLEVEDMKAINEYADQLVARLRVETAKSQPRPIVPGGAPSPFVEEAWAKPETAGPRLAPERGKLGREPAGALEAKYQAEAAQAEPARPPVAKPKPVEKPAEVKAEAPTATPEKPRGKTGREIEVENLPPRAREWFESEEGRQAWIAESNASDRYSSPEDVVRRYRSDLLMPAAEPAKALEPAPEATPTPPEGRTPVLGEPRAKEGVSEGAEPTRGAFSDAADAARARLKARRGTSQRGSAGLGPRGRRQPSASLAEDLRDYAAIGADLVDRGVRDFAKWSVEMVKEFGEAIKPHLRAIWAGANGTHRRQKYAGSINLEKLNTADDVKVAYREMADAYGKDVAEYRRGTRTWKQTQAAADEIQFTDADWQKFKPGEIFNTEQTQAVRDTVLGHMERVAAAKGAHRTDPTPENFLAMTQAIHEARMPFLVAEGNSTEIGRALNIHKKLAQARRDLLGTDKDKAWRLAKKLAGEEGLTDDQVAAFLAIPEGDAQGLYNFTRLLKKVNPEDKALYVFVSSILSGSGTHLRNMLWNINRMLVETPVRALRGVVDIPVSKLQGRPRKFYPEDAAAITGELASIPQGARKGLRVFMEGVSPEEAAKFETVRWEPTGGVKNPITWPLRALGGEDAAAKVMLAEGSLMEQATQQARGEGLRGKALWARVGALRRAPTIEMTRVAQEHADRLAMTGKADPTLRAVIQLREKLPRWARFPVKVVQPFVNVPWKLTGQVIEHSPINALRLLSKEVRESPEASDVIAKASLGSTVIAAIAVADGAGWIDVTGAVPKGQATRDEFYRTKKVPYSIRIGNTRVSYRNFGPYSFAFAAVAAAKDVTRRDPDADFGDRAIIAALAVGNYMADASFVSGLTNLSDLLKPDASAEEWKRWAARVGQGFMWPSGVSRTLTQMTDPYIHDPETMYDRFATNVPLLSKGVPVRVDPLGRDVKREGRSGLLALLPEAIPSADVDPVDAELARLGVRIGRAGRTVTLNDDDVTLTKPQWRAYQKDVGQDILVTVTAEMQTQDYRNATDEQRERVLRRQIDRARERGKLRLKLRLRGR